MFKKGDIMETIRNVDVNRLHDFKNHPFKVEMCGCCDSADFKIWIGIKKKMDFA